MRDNENFRFGSAGFETRQPYKKAGYFKRTELGLQLGYWHQTPIYSDSDGPILLLAGAGAGKLRDVLGYISCCYPGPVLELDLKRELSAIGIHNQVRFGKAHYVFDPHSANGCVINPLDLLKADAPTFHSDCKTVAADMITFSGAANAEYFEERARTRVEAIMKWMVEALGSTSFPELYSLFNLPDVDPGKWGQVLGLMASSAFEDVRQEAGEMKRTADTKEHQYIQGEIKKSFSFMSDPALQRALGPKADVSLEALCDDRQTVRISLCVSPEHVQPWSAALRSMFNVTMIYKSRHPASRRVVLLVDEAAQLGHFEGLKRAYAYGRGVGLRAFAVFQDTGQIATNFGRDAVPGFFGNAETRLIFGVRDEDTARSVSHLLGAQTLEYDDLQAQAEARRAKNQAVLALFHGDGDRVQKAMEVRHFNALSRHRSKQYRQLMTPDEILNMGSGKMLLFIDGMRPALVDRYPYWTRCEMAGQFMPNPYHPPLDRVAVQTRFGSRTFPVITETAPDQVAHLPQYAGGTWSYVKGYRPKI